MIELDGSTGEGGGQILRSALALSLLTGKPFRLSNIRANRPKPGLQPQHLASVKAAATIGNATTKGADLNSSVLVFEPGEVKAGTYHFPIGTAGATALVLHTIYLPLAMKGEATSELIIEGGTHVLASPCYHFLETTWRAYLAQIGINVKITLEHPGFYPRGGGRIRAIVSPAQTLNPSRLLEGKPITKVRGFSAVAGLPDHIASRQAKRVRNRLEHHDIEADLEIEAWEGGPGTVVALIADETPIPTLFLGLGEKNKPAEKVADEVADEVIAFASRECPVDPYSADQVLLPLAFAEGASEFRVSEVTRHLTTNIEVIKNFLNRDITCEAEEGASGVVRVTSQVV
jgi:RNA 3'-terminal phosphate cyclase (ATP)